MKVTYSILIIILLSSYAFGLKGDSPGGKVPKNYGKDMGTSNRQKMKSPYYNPADHGWGWALRQCQCSKSDNPCCTAECRHRYCLKTNTISSTVFPPECAPTVAALNTCEKEYGLASLAYKKSSNEEEADGGEKGNILVEKHSESTSGEKDEPIKIYEVEIKQGLFVGSSLKAITFTMDDSLGKQISFRYKTYDCTDDTITDKEYDTFTLSEVSSVGDHGIAKRKVLKKIQVPFVCRTPYYTVTTIKRVTTTLEAIESYRGIGSSLKSYEEDKHIYYIYVDVDKAKIEQLHMDSKSTRTIHKERYELNMKSCKYEVQSKDKVVKNLGGSPVLKSEDAGWGFEDDTKFYVDLPSTQKELSFTWGRLKEDGYYSNHISYKEKIPQLAKTILGKANDLATEYRNEAKNSKLIAIWKAQIDAFEPSPENRCGGKVALESALIPPVDGMQDPEIEFKIYIRQSTEEEKEVMKAYLKGKF